MNNEVQIKQILLDSIYRAEEIDVSSLKNETKLDFSIAYTYCQLIADEGYIDFTDASTKQDKDAFIELNGKGKLFYEQGGYLEQEKIKREKDKKAKRRKSFQTRHTIALTLVTIFTFGLGVLNYIQNNRIKQIKSFTNYEYVKGVKSSLVGKWERAGYNQDYSCYIFNEDNTWEYYYFKDDKKITYKGEFQIGSKNGVLLRSFGMHHWFHDTTYVDIQSGLRTSYCYLENNKLINNQEDYTNEYIKKE